MLFDKADAILPDAIVMALPAEVEPMTATQTYEQQNMTIIH